jgi:hypothetical protein
MLKNAGFGLTAARSAPGEFPLLQLRSTPIAGILWEINRLG